MSSLTWILLLGMAVCIHYNSAIPAEQADSTEPDLTDELLSLDDVPEHELNLREAETGDEDDDDFDYEDASRFARDLDEDYYDFDYEVASRYARDLDEDEDFE